MPDKVPWPSAYEYRHWSCGNNPQNYLIIPTIRFTEWIFFSHYMMYTVLPFFCPYVFCRCLKQRPNLFQSERNVSVNVTFNLNPYCPCWIHITVIMQCLQTSVPCCLCCVVDVVCPIVVLLLHDFSNFDFTVCATTVFRPPKNVVFYHDVVGIPDWFS